MLLTEEAAQSHESDEDMDILATYRKAKDKGRERKRRRAPPKRAGARKKRGRANVGWF